MDDNIYINIQDFEAFVRKRFDGIVNGKGLTVPRQIVGYAIDEIFAEDVNATQQADTVDGRKQELDMEDIMSGYGP